MTDILRLRDEIARVASENHPDRLAEMASDGLVMAFDKIAPQHLTVRGTSGIALQVHAGAQMLTSRQSGLTQERFARAVASIGHEISHPRDPLARLSQADYARAPIFTTTTPAGLLVFTPSRGSLVMDEDVTESLAEQAISRLANLLPEASDDEHIQDRLLSLRTPSARAVHEVALVAKSVGGLELSLTGQGDESIESVVTHDQADWIEDFLDDQNEVAVRQPVKGRIDGVRYKRRMFYLEAASGAEFSGTIDEGLVERVSRLVNAPVDAVLEKVTRSNRAGAHQKPTYRLVEVTEQPLLL